MRIIKRLTAMLLLLAMIIPFAGCGNIRDFVENRLKPASDTSGAGYNIYYISRSETGISGFAYQLTKTNENEIIDECLEALAADPQDSAYRAVLTGSSKLTEHHYDKAHKTLEIYFDAGYLDQPQQTQLLTRAAVVKTMTQFRNIVDYVSINIGGQWLSDEEGNPLKLDNSEYVSEITNDLDLLKDAKMTIYFVSQKSGKLSAYEAQQRYYNYSGDSLAAVVMDMLLRGPVGETYTATLSSSTQVRSIHISDGICSVDFNQAFLTPVENVSFEQTVYSVVNTLCELSKVSSVLITVEGNVPENVPDGIDLSAPLSPRAELNE